MRVVLRNVCKDIKGARVLDNVNLELESGMVYGFKGKNGSGKTMLMRAISGLIKVKGDTGKRFYISTKHRNSYRESFVCGGIYGIEEP